MKRVNWIKAIENGICPFCGKQKLKIGSGGQYGYSVWCLNKRCNAMGPQRKTEKEACKAFLTLKVCAGCMGMA